MSVNPEFRNPAMTDCSVFRNRFAQTEESAWTVSVPFFMATGRA